MVVVLFAAFALGAESKPFNHSTIQPFNSYTNHAGNAIAGRPVQLTATQVVLVECLAPATNDCPFATTNAQPSNLSNFQPFNLSTTNACPLSIFPESEQRRIAADFVLGAGGAGSIELLRVPAEVKRAVSGAKKAMARSRKRAEKGLCTQEESDAFCAESEAALASYLDKQLESGAITPTERKALER